MDRVIKKNLLDLHFHKNLHYKNTTLIIFFTYFIAILIPFLIGQLNPRDFRDMFLVLVISSVFITVILLFLNEFNYHLKRIPKELKKLK